MGEPEKKKKSLLSRPLLWIAILFLAAGGAAWFVPVWTCPVCKGIEEVRMISRPTRPCMLCDGTKKVGLPVLLERMRH